MEQPNMMAFGNQEEWIRFNLSFPVFVQKLPTLQALRDKLFVRKIYARSHVGHIVYGLGRVCSEDFEQVLNLCGNGFGIGALQLLRGMYERQVTAAYLSKNPDEVDDFLHYHHVHQRKAANHFRETFRGEQDLLNQWLPADERRKIEEKYEALPVKFREKCETCRRPIMTSWTPHHTGVLAKKAGGNLEKLYYYQFFLPTMFIHSTFGSIEARVVFKDDGTFSFESDGQRNHVREALVGAHNLVLNVFELQNRHFTLGLDDDLHQCLEDYVACWVPNELQSELIAKVAET